VPHLRPRLTVSSTRRRMATALTLAATAAAAAGCGAPDPRPATRVFSAAIEATPQDEAATMPCDPGDSFDKPGPVAFEQLLLATYGYTWAGVTRACDGSRSEHNEGRALDWGMDYTNTVQRQHGQTVIDWLRETDANGNHNAVARRLGIQYFIWNHQMYASWKDFNPTPYSCDGTPTSCHVNHIHFSFTWSGAEQLTSFWRSGPLPAARVGDSLTVDSRVAVPALAQGTLLSGVSYTFEASGTYRYGAGSTQVADAMCSPQGTVSSSNLRLAVDDDATKWVPVTNNGHGCNTADHRYRMTLRPWAAGQDFYAVVQDAARADNSGSLKVTVVAAG